MSSIKSGITNISNNSLTIGDGTSGDKQIIFDNGNATPPIIKWIQGGSKIQWSNDGTSFSDITYALPRFEIPFYCGFASNITATPTIIGAAYLDTSIFPITRTVKFQAILLSTSIVANQAAYIDIFDSNNVLQDGYIPVSGSEINNVGTSNPLIPNMLECDLTAAFSSAIAGVFEARLWIFTANAVDFAICESAKFIISW